MAMMMTGRVLLVCALCVLWCGAAFGHAMEDYCGEGGGNGLRHTSNGGDDGVSLKADCGLLSTRMALIKAVEAAEAGEESSGDPDQSQDTGESLPHNKLNDNTRGTAEPGLGGGGVAGQTAEAAVTLEPGGSDTGGQQVRQPKVVEANGKEGETANDTKSGSASNSEELKTVESSSSSGSPGPEEGEELPSKKTSKSDESSDGTPTQEEDARNHRITSHSREAGAEEHEVKKENTIHEAPTETRGTPANDTEIQTATPPPLPATMNGHSSTEDLRPIQLLQRVQDDHAESGPPSPTANGDAANNEADNSTEDGIPSNDPVADGAGTRKEKQNENKDANPKETPVTATAIKTTTATTGDSDGSTAVSHTTSPLLLPLLVACAAASAVVAA
ncbi:Mucin-associated surface protein (MASP) [Trypanosoma cruzi]|uniref:Mucin-associated surface protein (MASP), putative n=2 Tax=Trypanosoma cruzi TaxID=5693 RepID=Q4D9A2_TRYCC|nr:mucin-associated surface protein (MASP), putative [Trypanosoma cruzi]EAN89103.1 mucin-associated surface protein (MASP), putative [Trypanosoma cruzi]PWV12290.1 Mucin-associated surface protein (MASP) [Trypanosoma cruzi]RNC39416.1 mucin-associated surface protein (MASP) [Trypanosoma cruzi]|eukprot:XP_810954.1 mucin-associated surface protein (MASP) [Trypanosoma cruzi strain CL Brener]